jgi:hypothetical protein
VRCGSGSLNGWANRSNGTDDDNLRANPVNLKSTLRVDKLALHAGSANLVNLGNHFFKIPRECGNTFTVMGGYAKIIHFLSNLYFRLTRLTRLAKPASRANLSTRKVGLRLA